MIRQDMNNRLHRTKKILRYITFTVIVVLLMSLSTDIGRSSIKAFLFIPQVISGAPRPLEYVTPSPSRESINFLTLNGQQAKADLYIPAGKNRHPAVVFFMGVIPPDSDDSRIIALAEGLARTGMIVMIPWLDTQYNNRIEESDIAKLVDAFIYLEDHPQVKRGEIGMGGICTGASMITIAAQDLRINERVKFINSFAGYYDASDFIVATMSETRFYDGNNDPWKPNRLTRRLIIDHLISNSHTKDRFIIDKVLEKGTWTEIEERQLSENGQAILTLLSKPTTKVAQEAIQNLSKENKDFLSRISPSTKISNMRADVLIMHDTFDTMVPSEESKRFVESLKPNTFVNDVYHTEFTLFQNAVQVHSESEQSISTLTFINQAWKLYKHMYNIMRLSH